MPPDDQPAIDPTTATGRVAVRTTIEPDREIWVDAAEFTDLERHGLLLDPAAPRPEDAGAAPARRSTRTTKPAEAGDDTKD